MNIPRILHYPGSKWSMTKWIINHMPQHETYLEPFFGSGAVFFRKKPSKIETINDLDGNVVNLFKEIRDNPKELAESIRFTPYSREEYLNSYVEAKDDLEKARRFLVRCWQAIGAKTSDKTGWKNNVDADKTPNKPAYKQWPMLPEKILTVSDRLLGVQIENQRASTLIERYKKDNVLIYADPPYPLSTRSKRMYKCEMTDDDHVELLEILLRHPGPVLLSGYNHEIYNKLLANWHREEIKAYAESKRVRTEVLWINPVAAQNVYFQQSLFELG